MQSTGCIWMQQQQQQQQQQPSPPQPNSQAKFTTKSPKEKGGFKTAGLVLNPPTFLRPFAHHLVGKVDTRW